MIKVSICIPAYRQPDTLERCLDSIQRQTHAHREIIVTDDSPDDAVRNLVARYTSGEGVRYFRNSPPRGTPENWNEGLRRATGDYVVVMHHDDWFYTDTSLEALAREAEARSADLVFAQSYNVDAAMKVVSRNDPAGWKLRKMQRDLRILFHHNWIGAPSAVLFRNKGLLFDRRLRWLVDVEFYLRQAGRSTVHYCPEAIAGIGLGPSQATQAFLGNADVEIEENLVVHATLERSWRHALGDARHFYRLFRRLQPPRSTLEKYALPPSARLGLLAARVLGPVKRTAKKLLPRRDRSRGRRSEQVG
jgi:glycosyltransferase involved in cell wall biosynthesis